MDSVLARGDDWESVYATHALASQRLWIEFASAMDEYREAMGLPLDQDPFARVSAYAQYLITTSLGDLNATRLRFELVSAKAQLRRFIELWGAED